MRAPPSDLSTPFCKMFPLINFQGVAMENATVTLEKGLAVPPKVHKRLTIKILLTLNVNNIFINALCNII